MREDMNHVLVESPRAGRSMARALDGSRRRRRQRLDADGEGAVSCLGMRRDVTHPKCFGEHLGPLYRYLRQQLHRPWALVYGELCAQLDRRNVVQAHLFQHLVDRIHVDTEWRDGEVYVRTWRGFEPVANSHVEMFVHPRTGILLPNRAGEIAARRRRAARRAARDAPAAARRSGLPGMDSNVQWQRIGGIWYEVTLAPLDEGPHRTPVFDVVLKRKVTGEHRDLLHRTHGYRDRYAVNKHQLGSKTLRQHGLRSAAERD